MGDGARIYEFIFRDGRRVKESDEWWAAVTDPVNFVVGSVLLLFLHQKPSLEPASEGDAGLLEGTLLGMLLSTILTPALIIALPVLVGVWFPHLGTGDAFWFALTLLIGGAITLVPGRVAELRIRGWVRGSGYPKKLRRTMWRVEFLMLVGAIPLILVWNFGGHGHHPVVRAVVWGLVSVCLAELWTRSWAPIVVATVDLLEHPADVVNVRSPLQITPGASAQEPSVTLPKMPRKRKARARPPLLP